MFLFPAEFSHNLAIFALENELVPDQAKYCNKKLEISIAGLNFRNPVGLAAGFDKNANCIGNLMRQNFGFVEVGTVTPIPQEGNPKPRLFRLTEDEAIINRLGFNNKGVEIFSQRLRQWKFGNFLANDFLVGANIGKNKNSPNDASDYLTCLEKVCGLCDYITVNISSPNTPNLRELQKKENLENLVKPLLKRRDEITKKLSVKCPIFIKISPDEDDEGFNNIAQVCLENNVEGVIISNTTIKRNLGKNKAFADKHQQGGLSGKPLFSISNKALSKFYKITEGKIPIIGVGGIASAEDAYKKIRLGASVVQLYSSLIYQGFSLVNEINRGLVELLEKDGFRNIKDAVGVDNL